MVRRTRAPGGNPEVTAAYEKEVLNQLGIWKNLIANTETNRIDQPVTANQQLTCGSLHFTLSDHSSDN
ncbi:MAG: hypothetical protein JNM39_04520 [Bdellovibrionaceae bacterium]|nr:hypothetical protein [Pseudobdellovibrionaceae bacterium]